MNLEFHNCASRAVCDMCSHKQSGFGSEGLTAESWRYVRLRLVAVPPHKPPPTAHGNYENKIAPVLECGPSKTLFLQARFMLQF